MRRMFSEKQIEEMIKSIGKEIDFQDVDLKVKTIESTEPNWTQEIEYEYVQSDVNVSIVFGNVSQYNHKINIVALLQLDNQSGSSKTFYQISLGTLEFPTEIAKKLFDYYGDSVDETPISPQPLSSSPCLGRNITINTILSGYSFNIYNINQPNKVTMYFNSPNGLIIANGEKVILEARIELII